MNSTEQYSNIDPIMYNGDLKTSGSSDGSSLNSDTTIALSQSMDSVNTTPEDEVRTLFVSGLPMDAKPRELYLLFRSYKGYENALLKMMGKAIGKNNNGYEGSLLKVTNKNGKNTSPVGFVTFSSRVAAEAAKQDLQGVRFDPDLPQTLRLEFAKSNTKVTKPKQQSPQPATHPTLIHPLTGQMVSMMSPGAYPGYQITTNSSTDNFNHIPEDLGAAFFPAAAGPEAWAPPHALAYPELAPTALHHTAALMQHQALTQLPIRAVDMNALALQAGSPLGYEFHPAMMHGAGAISAAMPHHALGATPIFTSPLGGLPQMQVAMGKAVNGAAPSPGLPGTTTNSPCSTLFVANLGQFSSEQELKDLFSSFHGFSRLKMYNKGGSPVCFVEYQELKHASEAMNRLQGFVLLSSDRGGIRIEYAKHKMGEVVTA